MVLQLPPKHLIGVRFPGDLPQQRIAMTKEQRIREFNFKWEDEAIFTEYICLGSKNVLVNGVFYSEEIATLIQALTEAKEIMEGE